VPPLETDDAVSFDADAVRANASRRIVLPRFLRRPARALRRLGWRVPRHAGLKGAFLLFAATGIAGIVAGGHGTTVLAAVTSWTGFAVENLKITGQSETSEIDVLDGLALGPFPSLLTLELETARARVEALPWVKQATLTKIFPDTLEIAIVEREPYALWQHRGVVSLIDDAGRVITDNVSERYAGLPRVVGKGAAERVTEFTSLIEPFAEIARRAQAGVLVSGERWTVVLDNGMQLMLPAAKPEEALATIAALEQEQSVLQRQIVALDLRVPGKFVLRMTDDGVAAREKLLKERARVAGQGRTNT
jgi:cell division protein FtsQ